MSLSNFEFYIYKPQAATNLCTNPSFESSTTSWEVFNSTAALSTTHSRRGARSLAVAVTSDTEGGAYYAIALETATEYTFSADVETVSGLTYQIYFTDASSVDVGTPISWTGNGHWQRRAVTYTTTGAETFHARVSCTTANTSADTFYLDGCQIEASTVDTTYFDGDMTGFVVGQTDFGWNGTAHASTSWRSGQTRKGGTRIRLKDYLPAITVIGLGMPPIVNQAQPHTLGGSYYQNTIAQDRSFSILGELNGSTPGAFLTLRDALVDAVNHNQTAVPQPIVLEWQGLDKDDVEAADTCLIECHYSGGLEGNWQEFGYEQIPLQFQAFSPYVLSDTEHSTVLGYTTTVDNFSGIGYRDTDGQWKAMGTGLTTAESCEVITHGPDGSVYAGGTFNQIGGVADSVALGKWNGTAWASLGLTTALTGSVYGLTVGPDGSVYAGGDFVTAGGVAGATGVAKYDGSTWSALGTGMTSGTVIYCLDFGLDGSLYAGGSFNEMGGIANTVNIAKWDGSSWSALETGMDEAVVSLAVGLDGTLYAGGNFTQAGSTACVYVAKWNGTAWSPLGTGISSDGGGVRALEVGPDGTLYAGGEFTVAGGVTCNRVAKWNGTAWAPLGAGMDNIVYELKFGPDGYLYAGGAFTTAGGITMPDRISRWDGSTWLPLDLNVQDAAAYIWAIDFDKRERLYIGGQWVGSAALSATVTTPSIGTAMAYPKFNLTGPGKLWQFKNYTTGRSIFFNNLTLQTGETAVLDLNPERITFTSSWRGNLLNYILSGSNLDFPLVPGDNNISAYMTGTTAASAITMVYRDRYLSLDGAVY